MSEIPFRDRCALVTGASGAIGSAIAHRLAENAHVIVHYASNKESALAVAAEIAAAGGYAEAAHADLSRPAGAAELFAQVDRAFGGRFAGRLDVLVNNAGIFDFGSLVDASDEEFEALFAVNVRAVFQLSREAARRMRTAGWGRIINIGSVFGEAVPSAGLGLYSATKFAVRGFTRAWSRDLGPYGITVNNVQPALIQTEPFPTSGPAFEAMERFSSVGRFGNGSDIGDAVAFLASPSAAYINGETLNVDGGWSA